MNTLKKVWLTEQGSEIYSLSLESKSLVPHEKLSIRSMEFPDTPTEAYPKRHVINIGLLGYNDLLLLWEEIANTLESLESRA